MKRAKLKGGGINTVSFFLLAKFAFLLLYCYIYQFLNLFNIFMALLLLLLLLQTNMSHVSCTSRKTYPIFQRLQLLNLNIMTSKFFIIYLFCVLKVHKDFKKFVILPSEKKSKKT